MSLEIRVQKTEWSRGYEMMIWALGKDEDDINIGELTFKKIKPGALCEPTLYITKHDLHSGPDPMQVLMDDLWNCGLRPSEGTGSAGSLKATQEHLKDMRQLVFKDKEIVK